MEQNQSSTARATKHTKANLNETDAAPASPAPHNGQPTHPPAAQRLQPKTRKTEPRKKRKTPEKEVKRRSHERSQKKWQKSKPPLPRKSRGEKRRNDRKIKNGKRSRPQTRAPRPEEPDRETKHTTLHNPVRKRQPTNAGDPIMHARKKTDDGDIVTNQQLPEQKPPKCSRRQKRQDHDPPMAKAPSGITTKSHAVDNAEGRQARTKLTTSNEAHTTRAKALIQKVMQAPTAPDDKTEDKDAIRPSAPAPHRETNIPPTNNRKDTFAVSPGE
ncbi:hypothetical protein [Thalassobaculum litoreum]|uniref:hypothetical protein n=1 Tax=Thalassobaculum litoreum TaxID=420996 RepID=UPI001113380D|nr:hypothetical protein [Thalassobaculum litoreum]